MLSKLDPSAEAIKALFSDPKKLNETLRNTVLKWRFELHVDIIGIPKGKEQPNHDYALLFADNGMDTQALQAVVTNLLASITLPIKLKSCKAKRQNAKTKQDEIYNCIFLDLIDQKEA